MDGIPNITTAANTGNSTTSAFIMTDEMIGAKAKADMEKRTLRNNKCY